MPVTTAAMPRAAASWTLVRRGGTPTAAPSRLDAAAILAGQAIEFTGAADGMTIATEDVRHLGRFPGSAARPWATIP